MRTERDHYEVLGLPRTASTDDIKRRYRQLARKYHPDVAKDKALEKLFVQITTAYKTLVDPDKRAEYDLTFQQQGTGNGSNGSAQTASTSPAPGANGGAGMGYAPPASADAYVTEAQSLLAKNRFDEAILCGKRAVSIEPANLKAHAFLAETYEMLGMAKEAMTAYSYLIHYNPGDASAKSKLAALKKSNPEAAKNVKINIPKGSPKPKPKPAQPKPEPAKPKAEQPTAEAKPEAKPETKPKPTPAEPESAPQSMGSAAEYTGVVIDARAVAIAPAIFPKVQDTNKQDVYTVKQVSQDEMQKRGMASYATVSRDVQISKLFPKALVIPVMYMPEGGVDSNIRSKRRQGHRPVFLRRDYSGGVRRIPRSDPPRRVQCRRCCAGRAALAVG
jgi:curved DNA-binding protein CbpA